MPPFQSPKKQKQNKFLKYKHHNVHHTFVRMYISDLKKLSKMLQQYSELCLSGQYAKESRAGQYMSTDKTQTLYTTALQAAHREG
jgi:hypothetical protein